jgi:hypothetical protein
MLFAVRFANNYRTGRHGDFSYIEARSKVMFGLAIYLWHLLDLRQQVINLL